MIEQRSISDLHQFRTSLLRHVAARERWTDGDERLVKEAMTLTEQAQLRALDITIDEMLRR